MVAPTLYQLLRVSRGPAQGVHQAPERTEDGLRIPASGGTSSIHLRVPGKEQQLPLPALTSWQATAPCLGNTPVDATDPAAPSYMDHAVLDYTGLSIMFEFVLCDLQGQVRGVLVGVWTRLLVTLGAAVGWGTGARGKGLVPELGSLSSIAA